MGKSREQIKAIKAQQFGKKKFPIIPSQSAPKQKEESTLHFQARTGLILTPHSWVWNKKLGLLVDQKTNKPVEKLFQQ